MEAALAQRASPSVLTPWHAPQVSKAADVANQIAAEAIAAIRTVAAFSMEAELALQFRLELDKPWKKFVETALVTGLAYGSSFCVIFLVSTSCAPLPAHLVCCEVWLRFEGASSRCMEAVQGVRVVPVLMPSKCLGTRS